MSTSSWKFVTSEFEHIFEVEAVSRDPNFLLDCTHLSFSSLITGHTGRQSVYLINNEEIPLKFEIQDDSDAIQAAGWNLDISQNEFSNFMQSNSK